MLLEKIPDSVSWFFRITLAKIWTSSWLFQHPWPISGLFRTSENPETASFFPPGYISSHRTCSHSMLQDKYTLYSYNGNTHEIRTRQKRLRYCLIWAIMLTSRSNSARTSGALSRISSLSASNTISFSRSVPITSPATFLCYSTHKYTKIDKISGTVRFISQQYSLLNDKLSKFTVHANFCLVN